MQMPAEGVELDSLVSGFEYALIQRALERTDGVEYDLDGHVLPKVKEDPWGKDHAGPG